MCDIKEWTTITDGTLSTPALSENMYVCVCQDDGGATVCFFKQLLVPVEMKQLRKRHSTDSPFPHTTHMQLQHITQEGSFWYDTQLRCSVGGCTEAAATWHSIWRHHASHKTMSHLWDSVFVKWTTNCNSEKGERCYKITSILSDRFKLLNTGFQQPQHLHILWRCFSFTLFDAKNFTGLVSLTALWLNKKTLRYHSDYSACSQWKEKPSALCMWIIYKDSGSFRGDPFDTHMRTKTICHLCPGPVKWTKSCLPSVSPGHRVRRSGC